MPWRQGKTNQKKQGPQVGTLLLTALPAVQPAVQSARFRPAMLAFRLV
jgi:hypothetical protein